MRNTFNVLFYIKKNAPLRNGNAPIMGLSLIHISEPTRPY